MQNVLKHKDMYLEGFQAIFSLSFSFVLDHSEFIDTHIETRLGTSYMKVGNNKWSTTKVWVPPTPWTLVVQNFFYRLEMV